MTTDIVIEIEMVWWMISLSFALVANVMLIYSLKDHFIDLIYDLNDYFISPKPYN